MVTISNKNYVPERGDLVWLEFDPQSGHEQSGTRPAMVLTPSSYNKISGMALCCPITTKIKGYPFEVVLPTNCKIAGAILTDHIKSLDWRSRNAKFIAKSDYNTLTEIIKKILPLIDYKN